MVSCELWSNILWATCRYAAEEYGTASQVTECYRPAWLLWRRDFVYPRCWTVQATRWCVSRKTNCGQSTRGLQHQISHDHTCTALSGHVARQVAYGCVAEIRSGDPAQRLPISENHTAVNVLRHMVAEPRTYDIAVEHHHGTKQLKHELTLSSSRLISTEKHTTS